MLWQTGLGNFSVPLGQEGLDHWCLDGGIA
jgi:hypothetical protein